MKEYSGNQPERPDRRRPLNFDSHDSPIYVSGRKEKVPHAKDSQEIPQVVLLSAVARNNELQKQIGQSIVRISENTELAVAFDASGMNLLFVKAITPGHGEGIVTVGHYDPGMRQFLVYPEVVSVAEAKLMEPVARQQRAKEVQAYPEFDYDADIIQSLYTKHRETLLQDGLVYRIAQRYNNLSPEEKYPEISEYLLDESTSFFVCLTPQLGGIKKDEPLETRASDLFMRQEVYMSLSIRGDLYRSGTTMRRRELSFLHVGQQDLDDPEGRYHPIEQLVTDEEFKTMLDLVSEIQELKTTKFPNLDTEWLALRVNKS